jgi:hypothetical protein
MSLFLIAHVLTVLTGHAWAAMPVHHVLSLCRLSVSRGQVYANGCFTLAR